MTIVPRDVAVCPRCDGNVICNVFESDRVPMFAANCAVNESDIRFWTEQDFERICRAVSAWLRGEGEDLDGQ